MSKLKKMIKFNSIPKRYRDMAKEIESSFVDTTRTGRVKKTGFSASSLGWNEGKCPRAWYIKFNGADVTEEVSFFSRSSMFSGTARHEFLQECISSNENLSVEVEKEFKWSDPPLRGFIDIVVKDEDQSIPIEIKTCMSRAFEHRANNVDAKDYHILQILIYMEHLDSEMGYVLYENRDTFERVLVPIMAKDYEGYTEYLMSWMRSVYSAFENNDPPKFFKGKRSNSKICSQCPFKKECDSLPEGDAEIDLLEMPDNEG